MYIPKDFEIHDEEEIFRFIEANNFGQLVSIVEKKPFSTHMPFLVSKDRIRICGHVARQNPQHLSIEGQEVLITLEGPRDYISPSWYASPGVPTWNYQAVHIYGACSVFTDVDRLKYLVDTLSQKHESQFEQPWQPDYKSSMLKAIVGLEIDIKDIQCKYKLSQNKSEQDRRQVVENLSQHGSSSLASVMNKE